MTRIAVATGFHSWTRELGGVLREDEVVVLAPGDDARAASNAEVAIGGPNTERFRALLAAAPDLRWYHTLSAGVEGLMIPELAEHTGLVLTNNSGAYDAPIAEHVIATIFAAAKRLPQSVRAQARHEWHGDPKSADVRGSTLVVLGMGSIGGELAAVARGIGMRVIGVRRGGGDGAVPPDRLAEIAAEADYLAICAPLTPESRGLVGAEVIGRMKATAWLINISRGAIVDEDALLGALRGGRIAGAAIDAWWTEPLPADSPWWDLENVIVTPHTSFSSPSVRDRSLALILENLRRYKAGQTLLNVVDPQKGY
ncbi:D-2-hydroxyacid dehydrogenase [soil metagenome]